MKMAAVGLAVLLGPGLGAAPAAAEEVRRVTSFNVDISVDGDGAVHVREEIDYRLGTEADGPVRRELPTAGAIDGHAVRFFDLTDVAVEDDGGGDPVVTRTGGMRDEAVRVDFGAPDEDSGFTGDTTFVISYTYRDLLISDGGSRARLFQDIVGSGWDVPVDSVRARVEMPGDIASTRCYSGPPGSTADCGGTEREGTAVTFTEDHVSPGDALSIDVVVTSSGLPVAAPTATPDSPAPSAPTQDEGGEGEWDGSDIWWSVLCPMWMVVVVIAVAVKRRGGRGYAAPGSPGAPGDSGGGGSGGWSWGDGGGGGGGGGGADGGGGGGGGG